MPNVSYLYTENAFQKVHGVGGENISKYYFDNLCSVICLKVTIVCSRFSGYRNYLEVTPGIFRVNH